MKHSGYKHRQNSPNEKAISFSINTYPSVMKVLRSMAEQNMRSISGQVAWLVHQEELRNKSLQTSKRKGNL